MPTTPELSAGQEALRTVSVALLLVGGAAVASGLGFLKRLRGRRNEKPSRRHLVLGVAMLAGGLVAIAFQRDPPAEVITTERFSAMRMPAISVDAPPPWRLLYDAQSGRLFAHRPDGKLMIETSFLTDAADGVTVLNKLFDEYAKMGMQPAAAPFGVSFDGLQGSGKLGIAGRGSSAIWVIERPGKLFTIAVCTSESGHDAQTACDPVLSTLKWRPVGGST
jgi:hypothetical protein